MLYSKTIYLECEQFPFRSFLYKTMPHRQKQVHHHDFIELVYVAEGRGEHVYKGSSYPISKGDIFVIPPFVEHDYVVLGDAPLDVFNVMFLPSFLTSELQALSQSTPFFDFFYVEPFFRQTLDFESHMKLSVLEGQEIRQRLERIVEEYDTKALGYRISIKALVIEMLVWLSRRYEQRSVPPPFHANPSRAIQSVCQFLEHHYAQDIGLEQVCRMSGMSLSSFTAKFKQTMGKTFTEYRNEVRIHASLKPLRETDDKIIAIAESVGISDLSYYNKLFKLHTGLTPREYRIKSRLPGSAVKQSARTDSTPPANLP
ncbi:AraC family transcriptional regulator [Paenibacillus hodogayensis]|uniref:AraC family transcriptional regulator n=1 Tax=Paenibacillus hodogayensis TaxID=279208 RepID=A0ABV5VRU0_9BACL